MRLVDKPVVVELIKALVCEIPDSELASRAADSQAVVSTIGLTVSDSIQKEITVGHVAVVVIYGSENAVNQRLELLAQGDCAE